MSDIADFYSGQCLFVTGFTGFLGKVLVEKILRSCPDTKSVYVLIRPKKGQSARQRLDKILTCKLFTQLKQQNPDFGSKIIPISGDVTMKNLGIDENESEKLLGEISVVFNSAATVRFDEKLRDAVEMNVGGTLNVVDYCRQMTNLKAFVHVSTAYANCDRDDITEAVYPPALHPRKVMDAIEWMDDETIEQLTPKLLGNRPNTYTYTKAMAEFLLIEEKANMPVAIVRPSIVGATANEPFAGWVDNFNGPTGLFAAIGKGLLRIMKGDINAPADIIPVDITSNLLVAVGWYTGTNRPEKTIVYNCTSGQLNGKTWGEIEKISFDCLMKNPVEGVVRVPNPRFTNNKIWHDLNVFFDHYLPAYCMDFFMWTTGRKTMYVQIMTKIRNGINSVDFFTRYGWKFSNDNLTMLLGQLNENDKKAFDFDIRKLNWHKYIEDYCLGTKEYVLKEDLTKMPIARKAMNRLKRINTLMNCATFLVLYRILMTRVKMARNLWYFIYGMVMNLMSTVPAIFRT